MLSLVSVAIIALTVLPYIYELTSENNKLIALFIVAAYISIIVLTNINYGNRDLVLSEKLHRCALEINEVARELDTTMDMQQPLDFKEYSERYISILQKYSVNHDKVDFIEHKLYRKDEYQSEYSGTSGFLRA